MRPNKITARDFMCLSTYEKQVVVSWLTRHDIADWTEVSTIEETMKATDTDPGTVRITYRHSRRFTLITSRDRFPWPAALQTSR